MSAVDEKKAIQAFGGASGMNPATVKGAESGFGGFAVIGTAAYSNFTRVELHPSWGAAVQVQRVNDRDWATSVARSAGRRAVEKFGPALERLGE